MTLLKLISLLGLPRRNLSGAAVSEPHITYFNLGIYPIFVGFTTSKKAFAKEMKRLGLPRQKFVARASADASTHTIETASGKTCCIITMPKCGGHSVSQYAALVAHEAMHVIQVMHSQLNKGLPFGDEADAYLIQSIVQNCLGEEEGLCVAHEPRGIDDD